ncbi:MAG: transpeptidase family protein [Treponema sp.]|nr:transpeptidase family protein [Treponema sp.]
MNEGISLKKRFVFFASLLGAAAAALIIRYAYLMLGSQDSTIGMRTEIVSGRGPILDRNGKILAMETRMSNVTFWKPSMDKAGGSEQVAKDLAPILEIPAGDIKKQIDSSASNFIYLKKSVDDTTIKLIEDAQANRMLKGVGIEPMINRIYPEGSLAAQIIGFTTTTIKNTEEAAGTVKSSGRDGIAGIENAFNDDLSPSLVTTSPGIRQYQNGSQVYLTLDINVQMILENISANVYRDTKAEAVMFLAMDPRTGDILGSVSLPSFDPNNINNPSDSALMNRPAIWSYEPGSVFKIFSLSAMMDTGAINGDTTFYCNGQYEKVSSLGELIKIGCLDAHGWVNARDIIVYSCNAGAAYASDRITVPVFNDKLREYGFGSRTNAGNPGETMGFLRPVDNWSERSKPTIAIGQEIAVSALQMIQAASAVANDGILVPARIVSKIVSADGKKTREYDAGPPRQVLKAETARQMRSYMADVTSSIGTGWRADVADMSMAVKTGTAQLYDPNTKGYSSTDFIASCMAMLPAQSPSLILYLVIVKPKGEILGGRIAAPPIREAAEELINYLGIPRGLNLQITHPGTISLQPLPYPEVNGTVPDFTGVSKRQLLPLLLRDDLHFNITGDGWVKNQNPPPGTPIEPDTIITLELE